MERDRHAERRLRLPDTGDVIHVRVGEQDVADRESALLHEVNQIGHLVARVDDDRLARGLAAQHEAVLEEGRARPRLDDHRVETIIADMLIAAVDDLLFSSKIRTVAKQLGVDVVFARSPEAILREVRERRPPLLVIDLNGEKMTPVDTIRAVTGDSDLVGTRVVAFVSHVQTATIAAAQAAGAHDVMSRSAFTAALPEIVSRAR